MAETNPIGITGSDGIVPIYSPTGRWTMWSIDEIYDGGLGADRFIPKIKDYVVEPETFTTWIVEALDPVTFIPTLREIRPANMSFSLSQTDVLFGVGPGTQADTYRVYIDKSVTPHVLAVDVRLKIAGSLSSYAKIFKSSDVSAQGTVISRLYDNNNTFISENVPLELVAIDSHNNYSIKTVAVCNTLEELTDGEVVTVVIYSDQGHVVSKRQLLVENTAFIRNVNASQKYVSHISLETAFISPTEDHNIEFPLNIPLNALNMMGIVHYNDGSMLRLPVDGTKFSIFGLDQYVSSIVGQEIDLVLSYALAVDELAYGTVSADGHYITENYKLTTINPNNSYAVKLFVYPEWIDSASGYGLKWFMYNLDRNTYFDVTTHVGFAEDTGPFDPKLYGHLQRKTVNLNLADINGAYDNFIHVQSVDIVLNHEPDQSIVNTPWTVSHETVTGRPRYGDGLYAKNIDSTHINLSSGLLTVEDWLLKVYLGTYPLLDPTIDISPIDPTHFYVSVGGQTLLFPITDWDSDLLVNVNAGLFDNVYINFIKQTGTGDLELAVATMIVK